MKSLTVFSDLSNFENAQHMAKALTSSTLVPEHFRGDANMGNALIGLELAQRMDMSPMAVLQSLYVVQGRPAFSAQFLIACFNASGRFSPIVYEQLGNAGTPSFGYRAISSVLATGQAIEGPAVTMEIAEKDGWVRRNPKYGHMADLMLRWRAASWLVRTVAPELAMGLQTVEEVQDVPVDERTCLPASMACLPARQDVTVEALNASLGAHLPAGRQAMPAGRQEKPEQYVPPEPVEEPLQGPADLPDGRHGLPDGKAGLDSEGLPWNELFHSATKSQTQDGRWRVRRAVDEAAYKAWRADNRKPACRQGRKQAQDLMDDTTDHAYRQAGHAYRQAGDTIPQKSVAEDLPTGRHGSPVANLMEVWNPKIRACTTLDELDAVEEELAQAIKKSEPGHEALSLIDTTLEWTRRKLGGKVEEEVPF